MENALSSGAETQSYLSDVLHAISQALLTPDIILLILLMAYAVFCIGSVLMEFFTEHRHYKVSMPQFLAALTKAHMASIPTVIGESSLLRRQKNALLTVYEYRTLPGDALIALVRRLMNQEEAHYERITSRNAMAAKVAPMLGLVGTLVPLGPGIQALGEANTKLLSSSLLVAFDTTVAGLVVAAVCLVIGKIRSQWYDNYLSALDSAMATMVQKIEDTRTPKGSDPSDSMPDNFDIFGPGAAVTIGPFANALGTPAPFMPPSYPPNLSMPIAGVVTEEEEFLGSGMPNPKYNSFPKDSSGKSALD